jgi:hypothetical protein
MRNKSICHSHIQQYQICWQNHSKQASQITVTGWFRCLPWTQGTQISRTHKDESLLWIHHTDCLVHSQASLEYSSCIFHCTVLTGSHHFWTVTLIKFSSHSKVYCITFIFCSDIFIDRNNRKFVEKLTLKLPTIQEQTTLVLYLVHFGRYQRPERLQMSTQHS